MYRVTLAVLSERKLTQIVPTRAPVSAKRLTAHQIKGLLNPRLLHLTLFCTVEDYPNLAKHSSVAFTDVTSSVMRVRTDLGSVREFEWDLSASDLKRRDAWKILRSLQ